MGEVSKAENRAVRIRMYLAKSATEYNAQDM